MFQEGREGRADDLQANEGAGVKNAPAGPQSKTSPLKVGGPGNVQTPGVRPSQKVNDAAELLALINKNDADAGNLSKRRERQKLLEELEKTLKELLVELKR